MTNVYNFKIKNSLKNAVYYFFATNLTTLEEKHNLKQTFLILDKDGDGMLSKSELIAGFKEMGQPMT